MRVLLMLRSVRFAAVGLRRLIDLAAMVLVAALLVLFVLPFGHPPQWDTPALVAAVRKSGDPALTSIAPWVGLTWPAPAASSFSRLLPVLLGFAVLAVRAGIKALASVTVERCRRMEKSLTPRRRAPFAAPREAFAPPHEPAVAPLPAMPPEAEDAPERPSPPPPTHPDEGDTLSGAARTMQGAQATQRPGTQPAPRRIGRYQIQAELGRGAMGVVYRAVDSKIGRTVAIKKVLAKNLDADAVESYKLRFRREAMAAGQMSHPGIVAVHDITVDEEGQLMMVLEFIEGTTLDKMIAKGRLPLGQSIDFMIQVADALDYAHSRGVIHRDIKPANILVTPDGRTKITDFGIAKMAGTQLTQTGQVLGTPAFMSPEQFIGSAIDSRTDIFSLGSIFYWLCTGEKAFPGATVTAIAYKVVQTTPVPARQLNPALPADIDVILARCLAKSPENRYPTAHLLEADLEAFKAGRPVAHATMPPPQSPAATAG